MSNTDHFSDRLREPLNETTRKVRRNLMAASVVGVLITKVGLVPEKISAFGVEFTTANQQALILLLAASISYFAISFLVYVYSELTAWQVVLASKELEELKEASKNNEIKIFGTVSSETFEGHLKFLNFKTKPTFYIRLAVELVIPIVFSVYSCYALLSVDLTKQTSSAALVQEAANQSFKADAGKPARP